MHNGIPGTRPYFCIKQFEMKAIKALIILAGILFIAQPSIADNTKEESPAPKTISISGKITDQQSAEELVGVIVEVEGTDIMVYTDMNGQYTIDNLTPGDYTLKVKYISYQETSIDDLELENAEAKDLNIQLSPL